MMNVTVEGFSSQIMTNLTGPYFLAQEFLRQYEIRLKSPMLQSYSWPQRKGYFPTNCHTG